MAERGTRKRPYGWREQLSVGLAILVFVVGAPWAAFELSRRPLLTRAANIGERICHLVVDGNLGEPGTSVKVPGATVLGPDTSLRLRDLSTALRDACFYAVREGDLRGEDEATHILTIADYPAGDASLAGSEANLRRHAISLRISYHLVWTPIFISFAAVFGGEPFRLEFIYLGYVSGDSQFETSEPVHPLTAHGEVWKA